MNARSRAGIMWTLLVVYSGGCKENLPPPEPPFRVTRPEAATDLSAEVQAGEGGSLNAVLRWTDASSTEEGFKIERSVDGGAFAELAVTSADVAIFEDSEYTSSKSYEYRVRSFNNAGEAEQFSNEIRIPRAPAQLSIQLDLAWNSQITLSWQNRHNISEPNIVLEIMRQTGSVGSWVLVNGELTSDNQTYADTQLQKDTTYSYRLRACEKTGELRGCSAYIETSTLLAPSRPTSPQVTKSGCTPSGCSLITISWVYGADSIFGFYTYLQDVTQADPVVGQEDQSAREHFEFSVPAGSYELGIRAYRWLADGVTEMRSDRSDRLTFTVP